MPCNNYFILMQISAWQSILSSNNNQKTLYWATYCMRVTFKMQGGYAGQKVMPVLVLTVQADVTGILDQTKREYFSFFPSKSGRFFFHFECNFNPQHIKTRQFLWLIVRKLNRWGNPTLMHFIYGPSVFSVGQKNWEWFRWLCLHLQHGSTLTNAKVDACPGTSS